MLKAHLKLYSTDPDMQAGQGDVGLIWAHRGQLRQCRNDPGMQGLAKVAQVAHG